VLFPVRGAWVTSGEPSGSMVDGLMLYATKRTMKIAFGTLKPIFFGGLIVGTVALQTHADPGEVQRPQRHLPKPGGFHEGYGKRSVDSRVICLLIISYCILV
jgi:hypothetical protein